MMSSPDNELRAFIDSIPTLAWSASSDGSAQSFNRRWLDYTGLTAEEAIGWGWKVAVHPDDLPHTLEVFREALDSGLSFEVEGVGFDGPTVNTAASSSVAIRCWTNPARSSNGTERIST